MTRRVRIAAWAVLLALAAFQAYAQRFAIGPDGMAYLDLSDAVTSGAWGRLVDLYWSPLYPLLIGVARLVARAGAAGEVATIHAVNLAGFAVMLAAFDYMLMSILSLAAGVRGAALRGPMAAAGAYALFGVLALTMTPLELTTPDLFSDAAVLLALGALLRLRQSPSGGRRHAVVLGLALGVGALAKSFLVPWALVCFVTAGILAGRKGARDLAAGVVAWALVVVPWTAALSAKAGRPTFGDAGRLTYAWFVNLQDPPSMGGVPLGALTASTERLLPGVGVPGDSPYTDPMWTDPARFNTAVTPRFNVRDQLTTLEIFHVFYVENLAPLLFLILLVTTAPSGTRREAWRLGWPVYAPAIAGLFGYAMVLVTTRYVMPFVLAITLTLLATVPLARRWVPRNVLVGLLMLIGLEALLPETATGLVIVTAIIGGLLASVLVPARPRVAWMLTAVVALVVTRLVFPPAFPTLARAGAAAVVLLVWRASLAAVRGHRAAWFARRAEETVAFLLLVVLLFRLGIRFNQDAVALRRASSSTGGNLPWRIANDLAAAGISPGTRVAVVGPHAEAYWARAARLHIVASVPRNRVDAFWALAKPTQDSLLAEFHAAGATVAIATIGPPTGAPDSSWTPVKFRGWIRPLGPDSRQPR